MGARGAAADQTTFQGRQIRNQLGSDRAAEGFDKSQFVVDWDRQVVNLSSGEAESFLVAEHTYPKNGCIWEARFSRKDCTPCPLRTRCTKAKLEPRIIGLQVREHHEALQQARQQQQTEAFRLQYAARAGIESTQSISLG
jgi:transposase